MKFTLSIDTDNETFGPDPSLEVAWILRKLADTVVRELNPSGPFTSDLRDINGNKVGIAEWAPPQREDAARAGTDTEGTARA